MLSKKNRVDKKHIDSLFKEGKFIVSPSFTFRFILTNSHNVPCISFIAPKSLAKLAVERNRLRRRGYSVLEKYINHFPLGLVGVFVFKKYQASPIGLPPRDDISILENEIKTILAKIN